MKNTSHFIITRRSRHLISDSASKRRHHVKIAEDGLPIFRSYTDNECIRSWAVFNEFPSRENKMTSKAKDQLRDQILCGLRMAHLLYFTIRVTGDDTQNLLFIVNSAYNDVEHFARKFHFDDFLFAGCHTEKKQIDAYNFRDTAFENDIGYFRNISSGGLCEYSCAEHAHTRKSLPWAELSRTDEIFTVQYRDISPDRDCKIRPDQISPFRFPIDETIEYAKELILSRYGYIGLEKFIERLELTLDENRTAKFRMIKRAELYETRAQCAKRLRAIGRSYCDQADELERGGNPAQ